MLAQDIMITEIVTVQPETKVGQIANLFVQHRISCVPVVTEEKELVGLVTASDLIHRKETDTERRRKWWLDMFVDNDSRARDFVREHGLKARDVMSSKIISVAETAEIAAIADVLGSHRIRRVPVVRDGKLVGLISRSDLVRLLAKASAGPSGAPTESGALQKAIGDAINSKTWLNSVFMNFTVDNGVVVLSGLVDSEAQRQALRVLVEEVQGVQSVKDNLRVNQVISAA